MPYITQSRRRGIREHCDQIAEIARKDDQFDQLDYIEIVYWLVACTSDLAMIPVKFQSEHVDAVSSPLSNLIMELTERGDQEQPIGGDLNFSICRILVGATQIHVAPRYESKIQLIEEVLDYVPRKLFDQYDHPTKYHAQLAWGLGVIKAASKELYRRYVVPYEDIACRREDSGDIMD